MRPSPRPSARLKDRPARRLVDRRFVYIQPSPGHGRFRLTSPGPRDASGHARLPGFFRTIFGALSDLPREQPIRDNLDAIAERSRRIRRMRDIVDALRPDIEAVVEATVGRTLFLVRPTPRRLAQWRVRMQGKAASAAGFAYPAYAQLKLGDRRQSGRSARPPRRRPVAGGGARPCSDRCMAPCRQLASTVAAMAPAMAPARPSLPFCAAMMWISGCAVCASWHVSSLPWPKPMARASDASEPAQEALRDLIYESIGAYADTQEADHFDADCRLAARKAADDPLAALEAIARLRNLRGLDERFDERFPPRSWRWHQRNAGP